MQKYSGIDLHSNNNVLAVSDDADRVLYRRRLPNELGKVLEALEPHRAELVGVVVAGPRMSIKARRSPARKEPGSKPSAT